MNGSHLLFVVAVIIASSKSANAKLEAPGAASQWPFPGENPNEAVTSCGIVNGEERNVGDTWTDDCNNCVCRETGVATCTKRFCGNVPILGESSQNADESDDLPDFVSKSEKITVNEGDTVRLPCVLDRMGGVQLKWKKNSAIISEGSQMLDKTNTRIKVEEEQNGNYLVIRSAEEGDSGEYVCQISGGEPKELTHSVKIRELLEIFRHSGFLTKAVRRWSARPISPRSTAPANKTHWTSKEKKGIECDPFISSHFPNFCDDIRGRGFTPPDLTNHTDCTKDGNGIECVCNQTTEINLAGSFWTLPPKVSMVSIRNCLRVKIGNFFTDSENKELKRVSLHNDTTVTLLSGSLDISGGTVFISGVPNLFIEDRAIGESLKILGILNSEIAGLEEGAFHSIVSMDLFGIKNVTFPKLVAGKHLFSPNEIKIKELSLLDSNVGQMSYMFANTSSDKVLIINNLMDLVLDEGPVFDITADNLVIANNFFEQIRTNAMKFDVIKNLEITGNVIEYARKLCFENMKPSLPDTRFSFANNTFNNHYDTDTLIFDRNVLKLTPSNVIFENIIIEKQCSCHLAEKVYETKQNQKAILLQNSNQVNVDEIWKTFEGKLDESLSCYKKERETVLLATMMDDCMERASNLATVGIGLGASALLLTFVAFGIFIFLRKREKKSVMSDMKRLAVPSVLPKEEDCHMELEETVEFAQGSLPDLLQTVNVGSADTTPYQSMQHINGGGLTGGKSGAMDEISGSVGELMGINALSSTRSYTLPNSSSKALSGHSNVLMRMEDPDLDEDKYTSMVIHGDRKSTEWDNATDKS